MSEPGPASPPASPPDGSSPGASPDVAAAGAAPAQEPCPLCGAPLHPEQDWCLSCGGAARTRLAAAPRWKGFAASLAVVTALALGVLAAALIKLVDDSNAKARTTTTTITTAAALTPTTTSATGATQTSTSTPASTGTTASSKSASHGATATTRAPGVARGTTAGSTHTPASPSTGAKPATKKSTGATKLNRQRKAELNKKIQEDLHKAGVGKLLPGTGG